MEPMPCSAEAKCKIKPEFERKPPWGKSYELRGFRQLNRVVGCADSFAARYKPPNDTLECAGSPQPALKHAAKGES